MKRAIKIFFLIILVSGRLFSQNSNFGVYYSYSDYEKGKFSLELNCDFSSDKIRLHHFFSGKYTDISKDGKNYRFNKDSIFGYCDCDHNTYRFYKARDKEYKIVENKTIVIYIADTGITAPNGKAHELTRKYFFSTSLTAPILPLSIINLKRAFPDNIKFHDMLDVEFHSVNDISVYDSIHSMYKVNYLLNQSIIK